MLRLNLLLLLTFGFGISYGQNLWKRYRHEFSTGIGIANCLTDLGGGAGDGGYLGDLHFVKTRPSIQVGYRYKISEKISIKSSFTYLWIEGSDELSINEGRKIRNLSFRTHIYEFGFQGEYYFIKEPIGQLNTLNAVRIGHKGAEMGLYGLAGFAPFFYTPYGQTEDKSWHKLRELGTEGQGQPGGASEYGKMSIAFMMGVGVKFIIHRQLNVGIEGAIRYTATDYLDDVSTTYYDFSQATETVSETTIELADKRLSSGKGGAGGIRGNPENKDVYLGLIFSVNYKLSEDQTIKPRFKKKNKKVKF